MLLTMVGMLKLVQIKCTINSEPIIVCLERNFQADNIQPNEIINKNLKKLTMKKFYLLITWLSAFVYPWSDNRFLYRQQGQYNIQNCYNWQSGLDG